MSRRLRLQWARSISQLSRPSTQRSTSGSFPLHRQLRFEPLEDRRLLSITVNTLVDEQDGSIVDGDVSLRDAIAIAASGETIGFSVTGTINLTGLGDLVINKNLTINGPGASLLTIRAFNPSAAVGDGRRVFNVDDNNLATFKDVFISGLRLSGGDMNGAGGAIRNASENLTITACTISGNHALSGGGLHNNVGHLTVTGSTISGNTAVGSGAGIESAGGSLTVNASTISGNTSPSGGSGGGIFSGSSTATIDSSTISGNSANYGGGVIHSGAGILMTITNSTISGNTARRDGGGVFAFYGDVIVRHSTITLNRADSDNNATGNGGGVFVLGAASNVTIDHTIVAGNLRQVSTRSDVFGTVAASSAFNLVGVNTGLTGISNGTNGNQIGTAGSPINPLLGPLKNNSGPTFTHALLAGSPAIDLGDPSFSPPPTTDQRGGPFVRVFDDPVAVGSAIDIGAYERPTLAASFFIVDTLADESDGNFSAGDLSLREAINSANGSAGDETISFAAALTQGGPASIVLTKGELAIFDSMTISGPGADLLTIDASGNDPTPASNNGDGSRVFNSNDSIGGTSSDVEISSLTLTGGDVTGSGGAILADDLTVANCRVVGNAATFSGGGFTSQGRLTLINSLISDNQTGGDGGGIDASGASAAIINCTISGNTAANGGGGVAISTGGDMSISASTISGNTAGGVGGGIRLTNFAEDSLRPTITDSTISDNFAVQKGGGVYASINGTVEMVLTGSTVSGNRANQDGGGLFIYDTDLSYIAARIFHSTITNNKANADIVFGGSGGGIRLISVIPGSKVNIDHTIVAGNLNGPSASDDTAISNGSVVSRHSLVGNNTGSGLAEAPVGAPDAQGNIIGGPTHGVINPLLGPLADNGGPTLTHALLPGGPAIDAGDPAAVAGVSTVPQFDQRGNPFSRVIDGDGAGAPKIDIGAFELHPLPPATPDLLGDYNLNGEVDAADYVLWRKTLGTAGLAAFAGADGNGDGLIDQPDHGVWRANFGNTLPPPAAGSGAAAFVFSQSVFEVAGEAVVPARWETTAASVGTTLDTARETRMALFEPRLARHDSVSRPRGRINVSAVAESGPDHLLLLLAKDRLKQSSLPDVSGVDAWSDDDRADELESKGLIDESLLLALTDWQ